MAAVQAPTSPATSSIDPAPPVRFRRSRGVGYIMIGTHDLARARAFWGAVLALPGCWRTDHDEGITTGYTHLSGLRVWVCRPHDRAPATVGNSNMVALLALDRAAVDAVHAAALAGGGTCEGQPGPRPLYGPDFSGGSFRDPNGNRFAVVI